MNGLLDMCGATLETYDTLVSDLSEKIVIIDTQRMIYSAVVWDMAGRHKEN